MRKQLTIALLGKNFDWGGGVEFLRHIANGLCTKQNTYNLSLYLLLPVNNKIENIKDVASAIKRSALKSLKNKMMYIERPVPAYHNSMVDFFTHIQGKIEILDYTNSQEGLLRALKKIQADVVLPVNGSFKKDFPFPWVGYIYDFQHKYLTANFTSKECFERDINFASTLKNSRATIVNSQAVKNDILKFFPYTDGKIFSLPFSPNPMPEWFTPYPDDLRSMYNLPQDYFLISNQFWIHKGHLTAFSALDLLKNDQNFNIVCTGSLEDYRNTDYINEINNFIVHKCLTERIKILGHIPKRDQIEIMNNSIGVIQPTLFEGGPGGGCTYDAVSLGIPVILSDIPVNQEVDSDNILFFRVGESADLAKKMCIAQKTKYFRKSQNELLIQGQLNLENLGDTLLEAIDYVV